MKPRKLISPPALNDPRTRQDLETLLRMIREGLCGMDDVRSLHDMMNMLHTKQDGEEVFRFTMNWLAAPFQQPGLNLGTNLWQLGPLCPSRSLALASRMALRKCPSRTENCCLPAADRRASGPRRDGCCRPPGDCRSMIALIRISSDSWARPLRRSMAQPMGARTHAVKPMAGSRSNTAQIARPDGFLRGSLPLIRWLRPARRELDLSKDRSASLFGLPVTVKESLNVAGLPTTRSRPWSSPLGCRVKASRDLGAIGDVHLIARL